jgi:trans-aconitate methyltransferase
VLTRQLAQLAAHVVAIDFAPSDVAQAQRRCAALSHVEILCADLASFIPAAPLDLIVFSEIGYYFLPVELGPTPARFSQVSDSRRRIRRSSLARKQRGSCASRRSRS